MISKGCQKPCTGLITMLESASSPRIHRDWRGNSRLWIWGHQQQTKPSTEEDLLDSDGTQIIFQANLPKSHRRQIWMRERLRRLKESATGNTPWTKCRLSSSTSEMKLTSSHMLLASSSQFRRRKNHEKIKTSWTNSSRPRSSWSNRVQSSTSWRPPSNQWSLSNYKTCRCSS